MIHGEDHAHVRSLSFERLRDENEQLRTALESAHDEISLLTGDRERLMTVITANSRDQGGAEAFYRSASGEAFGNITRLTHEERDSETDEELRVAVEVLQVLTEELEVANRQLLEQNAELDRRVAERTTELQAANAALETSDASFRAIADLVPDCLWRTDPVGHVMWFSRRWYELTGQVAEEARGAGWLRAIDPADRDRLRSVIREAIERGEAYSIEARVEGWRTGSRWFLMRAEPFRDEAGKIVQWFGAGTDIHDQRLTFEALEASELRFRTLVEGVPQLVWRSFEKGDWTWSSSQWGHYTGQSEAESLGLGWLDAWHPDDRDGAIAAWERAGESGDLAAEGRIFHVGEQRYRHFRTRATAVITGDGRTIEWLGTSTDVDDIIQLQQQQAVLVAELQHRTRNILAVIRSVMKRTVRGSKDLDDFGPRIEARLAALARVQGLLSQRADNRRIAFDQLLRAEIGAHVSLDGSGNGPQVTTAGPDGVPLYSATIQTMALGLHELMTNAIKYGALATPDGHLDVSWKLTDDEEPRLFVEWRESGVTDLPAPDEPARGSGYGRELIERALPYQLGARTTYRFERDGVYCTIEVPVAKGAIGGPS